MERFEQITPRSKYVSLASVLSIIVAIFGFGYGWTGTHDGFYTKDEDHQYDPTVSYAIGNGLKPAIVTLIAIGGLLAIYTLYLRKGKFAIVRYLTVAIILGLLIAITYVNPTINGKKHSDTENNAHYILAVTAFTITLIFNLVTYYLLYKNYLSDKWLFLLLGLINFGIYLGMYVIVYIIQNSNPFFSSSEINNDRNKEYKNLGASAEIIQILFFLLTILLMGFYKTGVGVIKKKMRK
jgi:hypothetical protein